MTLEEKLNRAITHGTEDVFVRAEFENFGSKTQISRVLRNLIKKGFLVKLGIGVYAKATISVLSGATIPIKPIEVLAPIALRKLGVEVFPSQATQDYNEGKTSQIPAGVVLNTGDRRITRKIGFGKRSISYEKNKRNSSKNKFNI